MQPGALWACIASFFTLLLAGACASHPQTVDQGKLTQIKTVGVVSLVQNKLSATQATGILALSNEYYDYDVEDWALQGIVEMTIEEALRKSGRFEVVHLTYNPTQIWQQYSDKHGGFFLGEHSGVGLIALMQTAITEKNLDAIVAALPGYSGRHCFEGPPCAGYGEFGFGLMLRRSGPFGPRAYTTYVSIDLSLLDVETGKPIAVIEVNEHRGITLSHFASSMAIYSDAERERIRDSLVNNLMPYVPAGLSRMRLTY